MSIFVIDFTAMIIKKEISKQYDQFAGLCKKHNVKHLYAFGSSLNDSFDKNNSDIDLVVEIDETDPVERGEKLISLWDSLESFFNRRVDLLTDTSIRNSYLKNNIDTTKVLIYDGKNSKVLV